MQQIICRFCFLDRIEKAGHGFPQPVFLQSYAIVWLPLASTSASETEPDGSESEDAESESSAPKSTGSLIADEEISNSSDGEHAIEADGETASYSNVRVTKTGDSEEGDEADFYGDNSAIFATNGATMDRGKR